jgi:hypothetical protein
MTPRKFETGISKNYAALPIHQLFILLIIVTEISFDVKLIVQNTTRCCILNSSSTKVHVK